MSQHYPHLLWCSAGNLEVAEKQQRLRSLGLTGKAVPHFLASLLPKFKESRDRLTRVKKGRRQDYSYPCCKTTRAGPSIECSTCNAWVHFACEQLENEPPSHQLYHCRSCLLGKRSHPVSAEPAKRQRLDPPSPTEAAPEPEPPRRGQRFTPADGPRLRRPRKQFSFS